MSWWSHSRLLGKDIVAVGTWTNWVRVQRWWRSHVAGEPTLFLGRHVKNGMCTKVKGNM